MSDNPGFSAIIRQQMDSESINPPIADSAMFAFQSQAEMAAMFSEGIPGRYLYARHHNPSAESLARALASLEGTEDAQVTASGMSAIACTIMQIVSAGEEIVASRTLYGGTYALLRHVLPRFGIRTSFVDIANLEEVRNALSAKTKLIYAETLSNPLLVPAPLQELSNLAKQIGCKLAVDNTFAPVICKPIEWGADVIIHSLTKYINGQGDRIGGAICGCSELIADLKDVNYGAAMLFGPCMDGLAAASIRKNLQTLEVRMGQHNKNALAVAQMLEGKGLNVAYPGLKSDANYSLASKLCRGGCGGVLTVDMENPSRASQFMTSMQNSGVGFLAVSLGYVHTLFCAPESSTSSEIPEPDRQSMKLSPGLVRISVGIDSNTEQLVRGIQNALP